MAWRKNGRFRRWVAAPRPYLERSDRIDVWRLLNAHNDVPAWLRDDADEGR